MSRKILKPVGFIIKYWIGWIIFFEICRLVFLLVNFTKSANAGFNNFWGSLFYGCRMDMSMAAYITLPVCLFVIASILFKLLQKRAIYFIYSAIIAFPVLLLLFADIGLFNAWGARVGDGFLKYLLTPKEAYASVSHLPVFIIILSFIILYALLLFCLKKWLYKIFPSFTNVPKWSFVMVLVLMGLFIIPLRGGLQLAPLNQSSVYFSKNNFSNLAAINPIWNFIHSVTHRASDNKNPFIVFNNITSKKIVDSLLSHGNNLAIHNTQQKPNVILIIWESFTEKAIHTQKNGIAITPGFNQLKNEGIYFSNIYATGDRTDKGIVSVLSGYPAQPTTSIVKLPAKIVGLPFLPKNFTNNGYHTAFYYGGELEFANMKAYLLSSGFSKFTSIIDFDKNQQNSKWGAHDEVVMEKLFKDVIAAPKPFFYTWLTLSSHEPFETPVETVIDGEDTESEFLNSLHYTDKVLFEFIERCKKQSWWQNTIVAIVADHGHSLPHTGTKEKDFHIPMLFLGGNIQPQQINTVGSQIDLPAILSYKTGLPFKQFTWSKNIMDSTVNDWAYFAFDNGFGFVNDSGHYIFDNIGQLSIASDGADTVALKTAGQAFLQQSFDDYLKR